MPFDSSFIHERIGLKGIEDDQEIWRFMPIWKADDLFKSAELYFTQVARLRLEDPRESRLPNVIRETVLRSHLSASERDFFFNFLRICEDQAARVYASCWFMPGSGAQEEHMWAGYTEGEDGGICVISTIHRLISALSKDNFGLGRIRYIGEKMTYREAFNLTEYRSYPFLLKTDGFENEREIRLFKRHAWSPRQPDYLRHHFDWTQAIHRIRISPMCAVMRRNEIYEELVYQGMPSELIEMS